MTADYFELLGGLVLFGVGLWLGLVAELGVGPWDVLTGGLAQLLGAPFGRTAIGVSVVVLLIGLAAPPSAVPWRPRMTLQTPA
ncbi:MAG: hypothetical protein ACR2K2_08630 [Mycobacteriales bacterium]